MVRQKQNWEHAASPERNEAECSALVLKSKRGKAEHASFSAQYELNYLFEYVLLHKTTAYQLFSFECCGNWVTLSSCLMCAHVALCTFVQTAHLLRHMSWPCLPRLALCACKFLSLDTCLTFSACYNVMLICVLVCVLFCHKHFLYYAALQILQVNSVTEL